MFRAILVLASLLLGSVQSLSHSVQDAKIYEEGHPVLLTVNRMTSTKTQISMDYYRLPFCQPHDGPEIDNLRIGEFLTGERTKPSPYVLNMKTDMYCEQLCIANLDSTVYKAIHNQYRNNWRVDNLPLAYKTEDYYMVTIKYWGGFPIGYISDDTGLPYIYNHVNIEIMYHPVERDISKYQIVRIIVQPFSIQHEFETLSGDEGNRDFSKVAKINNPIASCDETQSKKLHTEYTQVYEKGREPQLADGNVLFTYDVIWIESEYCNWANRWDIYLTMDDAIPDSLHLFPIYFSFGFVLVLSGIILTILVKSLRHDIEFVPDRENGMEEVEECRCKALYDSPFLYSVFCGTGAQILCSSFMTIICCFVGIASPAHHGSILTAFLFLYIVSGGVGGYVTARFYKSFQGESVDQVIIWTAIGFPGITIFFFFLTHILLLESDHSYPAFQNVMVFLLCLWLGVNTSFVILGSQVGYREDSFEFVGQITSIHRDISRQPWFLKIPMVNVLGACILFGTCIVELYYILQSVWLEYYYNKFGFFLVMYLHLALVCAEVNILCVLLHVRRENYHWLWYSFYTSGCFAIFIFLYSVCHLVQLEATSFFVHFLFFGCMGIVCFAVFLMMGFIGVSAILVFNKILYYVIKSDKAH